MVCVMLSNAAACCGAVPAGNVMLTDVRQCESFTSPLSAGNGFAGGSRTLYYVLHVHDVVRMRDVS